MFKAGLTDPGDPITAKEMTDVSPEAFGDAGKVDILQLHSEEKTDGSGQHRHRDVE
ncbi:hypothetical protein H2198_008486 [Neophaeococcomyces mojaviensis]|uniref:Uncharacterized protein n=1 Tax=Neophaeococcomyces mojaviensis TaxID=3383035 RepID=A0ACC2ZX03_9EURO|nr:hypothetical protein H2198_008486 [Knufia sp. JES_112]